MIKLLSLTCWRRLAQGSFLALALQLLAAGSAWAECNVTLSSFLPNNQAVFKADCGSTSMTSITWMRDANGAPPLVRVDYGPFSFPATVADLYFTTLLTSGTHSYTASGNVGTVVAGRAAVVTLSQPILTVAVSAGGSVTSAPKSTSPPPPGIDACTASGGVCTAAFDTGTAVVLTATALSGNSFSSWGGDCSGITSNICTVSMTTLRTVTATFTNVPTWTVTGGANPSAGGAVNCANPVTNGNTTTCAIVITPNYNVTGTSSTCGGSLSGNTYTTGSVTSNCTVNVNFSLTPTSFTVTGVANGNGSVSCSSPVNSGGTSSCTINANANYTLAGVSTNACNGSLFGNSTAGTYTTGPVISACTVTATFTQSSSQSITVTGVASPSPGGSVSCTGPVTSGGTSTCTITTNQGYTLTGASSSTCGGSVFGNTFSTGQVFSACTVTATFSGGGGGNTADCSAFPVFGDGDADWNPLTNTKMFPSRPIEASGDRGTAIRFVADPTKVSGVWGPYPNGVVMEVFDQSGSSLLKDAVISVCPHSFNPVGGNSYCEKKGIANQGDLPLRFGPARAYYDCALTPGTTYYLNFRAYDVPRGTVASQFTNFVR